MAQAGRRWQRSLFPWLQKWGFTQCASDPYVFTCTRSINGSQQSIIIGCYVDDLFCRNRTSAVRRDAGAADG
eukprot:2563170-Pleurochrysis_carterae.AAC.1